MAGNNNAILEIIRGDHDRIATLLNQIVDGHLSEKKRKDAFDEVRREITRHSMLEEEVLYPKLKDAAMTKGFVSLAAVHHSSADRLINLLEYLPMAGPSWEARMRELRDVMISHMRFEELELRQLLPRAFSQSEIGALVAKIRLARAA